MDGQWNGFSPRSGFVQLIFRKSLTPIFIGSISFPPIQLD
jgi:hypothetical protein